MSINDQQIKFAEIAGNFQNIRRILLDFNDSTITPEQRESLETSHKWLEYGETRIMPTLKLKLSK
jgi:hypothetical protein